MVVEKLNVLNQVSNPMDFVVTNSNQIDPADLRVVTLDNFYKNIENPLARYLFAELALLRARSYGQEYPENFLPLDSIDFIARHHLFCLDRPQGLYPIASIRLSTWQQHKTYRISTSLEELIEESRSEQHKQFFKKLMAEHLEKNHILHYTSKYAVDKKYRKHKELRSYISEVITGLIYLDIIEQKAVTSLVGSVLKFNTHFFFKKMGYQPIQFNESILSPLLKLSAGNIPVLLMSLQNLSPYTKECFEKHKQTILCRTILQKEYKTDEFKIAA